MEDDYGDDAKKLALLTTSFRQAKADVVKTRGIGEDLPFNFFGWKNDELAVTVQMEHEVMNLDLFERFDKSYKVCNALRQYWGIDEITMIAEGFLSYDPIATSGRSLREAFAKNEKVAECISLAHAFTYDGSPQLTVVAMPYSYDKKEVIWDTMIATPNEAARLFRESIFPAMLVRAITETIYHDFDAQQRENIAEQIVEDGFQLYDFCDDELE